MLGVLAAASPSTSDLGVLLGAALALLVALAGARSVVAARDRAAAGEAGPRDELRVLGGSAAVILGVGLTVAWVYGSLAYERPFIAMPDASWAGDAFGGGEALPAVVGMVIAGVIAARCFAFAKAGGPRRWAKVPGTFYVVVALLMVPVFLSEFRVAVLRVEVAQKISAARGDQTIVGTDGRAISVTKGTFAKVEVGEVLTCRVHVTPLIDQISPMTRCTPFDPAAPKRRPRGIER